MIHLLRANHANEFELQNYKGIKNLEVITSQHPLTDISLPSTKLWSPTDLPRFPFRRQLLNRAIGGEQWLVGLEKAITHHYHNSNHSSIVHTAETYTPYTHQAVQLRRRGVIDKLVCTCWETIPGNNEKFMRLRKWKAEAYKYVDVLHTPTRRAKDALIAEGVDLNKIVVIPYGVNLLRFHSPIIHNSKFKIHKRPTILMVARPVYEKGIDIFREVSQQLASMADFRLVSDAKYSDMPSIYQSADLFFLPSRATPTWEEQYGMALIEAMASGLPIVTTDSGAIPEVIGDAGITLQECDVDKMVTTIRDLLSHPDLLRKYSSLSLARARNLYDSGKIAIKLGKLYS